MPETNTYVISVNGDTGNVPFLKPADHFTNNYNEELGVPVPVMQKAVYLDAGDIKREGTTGNSITQELQLVASTMRPLILEQIGDSEDFIMHLGEGISFEPINPEE